MADARHPARFTRRTFLGWWMASLLTATVVTGVLPILVYLWPAPPKGQKKGRSRSSSRHADRSARRTATRSSSTLPRPRTRPSSWPTAAATTPPATSPSAASWSRTSRARCDVLRHQLLAPGLLGRSERQGQELRLPVPRLALPPRRHRAPRARRRYPLSHLTGSRTAATRAPSTSTASSWGL